jgi:hypothetical protein
VRFLTVVVERSTGFSSLCGELMLRKNVIRNAKMGKEQGGGG